VAIPPSRHSHKKNQKKIRSERTKFALYFIYLHVHIH
jgi:hypothetical protein